MTSRREFLRMGLAASTVPLLVPAAEAGALPAVARGRAPYAVLPLYKVLYDVRFPASVAFARRAGQRGAITQAMAGDVTRVWYDDLYHRWQRGPAAIAGLTGYGALFCLERLAWDHRMRVVFRAAHQFDATQPVIHEFAGPAALLPTACRAATDPSWAEGMADVVLQCPVDRGVAATARAASAASAAGNAAPAAESLVSWVIAPVGRSQRSDESALWQ